MENNQGPEDISPKYEALAKATDDKHYELLLYVTGSTLQSIRAIKNTKKFCEENIKGHYELQIIDLYQQPELAHGEQIVVAPTLIKKFPLPLRKVIGDMSDTAHLIDRFNIPKTQVKITPG